MGPSDLAATDESSIAGPCGSGPCSTRSGRLVP